jgi:uncharacterized tellurite resistance protein B-like protein
MSIVAALMAAMGLVGVLLWRLNQASDAAKGLLETAEDTRGFFRRMAWRRKSGKNPLDVLDDPREAAAAMMAAIAQWDAAISDREMDAIRVQTQKHFQADGERANELLATGRWLARDVTDLGAFLRRASSVVLKKCTPKERQDLLAMLNAVANIEGRPNALITQELERLGDYYKRAAAPR